MQPFGAASLSDKGRQCGQTILAQDCAVLLRRPAQQLQSRALPVRVQSERGFGNYSELHNSASESAAAKWLRKS